MAVHALPACLHRRRLPAIIAREPIAFFEGLDRTYLMAVDPGGGPGEEFRKKIDGDIKLFAGVAKSANLKFEQ